MGTHSCLKLNWRITPGYIHPQAHIVYLIWKSRLPLVAALLEIGAKSTSEVLNTVYLAAWYKLFYLTLFSVRMNFHS